MSQGSGRSNVHDATPQCRINGGKTWVRMEDATSGRSRNTASEDNITTCTIFYEVSASVKDAKRKKWQLVVCLSMREFGFDSRSVPCKMYSRQISLEQGFLLVLRVSTINIIPPKFHIYFRLHPALIRRKKKRYLRNLPRAILFQKSGRIWYKNILT